MDDDSIPDPATTRIPTQADLVRALESIDDSVLAQHHANADAHVHDHDHDHTITHDGDGHAVEVQLDPSQGQGHGQDVIHHLAQVQDVEQHAGEIIDAAASGSTVDLLHRQPNDVSAHIQQHDSSENIDKQLLEWSKEQLQAEVIRLRSLVQPNLNSSSPSTIPTELSLPTSSSIAFTAASEAASGTQDAATFSASTSIFNPTLTSAHAPSSAPEGSKKRGRRKKSDVNITGAGAEAEGESGGNGTKRPSKKSKVAVDKAAERQRERERDEGTGKRLEKERRTELGRVIRTKIRSSIGVSLDAALPHPVNNLDPITGLVSFVPEWSLTLNDETNAQWINNIAQEVLNETSAGMHPKVPTYDISKEIIDAATKTAFLNMCKRYANENDPKGVERREKYTKRRRRWARKDLKQKRRFKSAAEPLFADITLPPSAFNLDYMSSEYSSSGAEDDDGEDGHLAAQVEQEHVSSSVSDSVAVAVAGNGVGSSVKRARKRQWADMRGKQVAESSTQVKQSLGAATASGSGSGSASGSGSGKGGWAVGVSEKVLEVRTPRWRSDALNEIYRRLDAYANEQADTRATGSSSAITTNINSKTTPSYLASISDGSAIPSTSLSTSVTPTPTPTPTPKPGHVAPSHRRFVMPPELMRDGKAPRNLGEWWMWASGQVGVWPERERQQAGSPAAAAAVAPALVQGGVGGVATALDGTDGETSLQIGHDHHVISNQHQDQDEGGLGWTIDDHVHIPTLGEHHHDHDHDRDRSEEHDDPAATATAVSTSVAVDADSERDREEAHRLGLVSALEGL
ncbi:hypothetical protein IAU59_003684 [Kwoniella sp. CBS 9459]